MLFVSLLIFWHILASSRLSFHSCSYRLDILPPTLSIVFPGVIERVGKIVMCISTKLCYCLDCFLMLNGVHKLTGLRVLLFRSSLSKIISVVFTLGGFGTLLYFTLLHAVSRKISCKRVLLLLSRFCHNRGREQYTKIRWAKDEGC